MIFGVNDCLDNSVNFEKLLSPHLVAYISHSWSVPLDGYLWNVTSIQSNVGAAVISDIGSGSGSGSGSAWQQINESVVDLILAIGLK